LWSRFFIGEVPEAKSLAGVVPLQECNAATIGKPREHLDLRSWEIDPPQESAGLDRAATSALSVFQSLPTRATRLVVINCRGMPDRVKVGAAVCQDIVLVGSVWPRALSRRIPKRSA
jgi:hypothetical protein